MSVKKTIAGVLVVTAATVGIYLATSTGPKTWTVTTSAQLATAEQSSQPGDTVQLSGTFHVPFVPKVSGTATAPIVYQGTATSPWQGYNGNTVTGNSLGGLAVANVNDVTYQGHTTHVQQSLAVFEASDPLNVKGNS